MVDYIFPDFTDNMWFLYFPVILISSEKMLKMVAWGFYFTSAHGVTESSAILYLHSYIYHYYITYSGIPSDIN